MSYKTHVIASLVMSSIVGSQSLGEQVLLKKKKTYVKNRIRPTSSILKAFRMTFLRTSPSYVSSIVSAILQDNDASLINHNNCTTMEDSDRLLLYASGDVCSQCVHDVDWRVAILKLIFFTERNGSSGIAIAAYQFTSVSYALLHLELPMMNAFSRF